MGQHGARNHDYNDHGCCCPHDSCPEITQDTLYEDKEADDYTASSNVTANLEQEMEEFLEENRSRRDVITYVDRMDTLQYIISSSLIFQIRVQTLPPR